VRTDLADVHIAVCAPEVLLAFSDNFDYQHVRRDFVPGVLSEEELGHKLYVHEAPRGAYAARVHNLRSYDAVSRDVLGRWAFPFAPDTNLLGAGSAYAFARGGRYLEAGVSVPRTAVVGPQCAIGAHTEIGEGARIEASVVGRGCTVGRGAELLGCYLMDGAVVQEGARLRCVSLGCVAWGARGRGHCMFALSAGCRLPQRAIADSIPSPPPHPQRATDPPTQRAGRGAGGGRARAMREPSPMYFWTSSEPDTRMKVQSVWCATARASSVLPVPVEGSGVWWGGGLRAGVDGGER